MDRRMIDRQTDGQTQVQCETIIPHHYHVAGYKKKLKKNKPKNQEKNGMKCMEF